MNFKTWLEVSSKVLGDWGIPTNVESERTVIGINGEEDTIGKFLKAFRSETGIPLSREQLKKGTVPVKTSTEQGEKTRETSVGNILKKKKMDRLFDLYSSAKDRVSRSAGDGYSIIISKNPIDVARMSDHCHDDGKSISSCHSPGQGYFKSAVQESRTGGAVAYAVKTADLEKVDLAGNEIFKDEDRKIPGIVPVERLRLRRFVDGEIELLVPEIRTYGAKEGTKQVTVPGFQEAVIAWAKKSQENEVQKAVEKYGSIEDAFYSFNLKGGSYQDNDAGELWSKFFGVVVSGHKDSVDEEPGEHSAAQIHELAEKQERQHRKKWKNKSKFDVHFHVDQTGEEPILFWEVEMNFEVPVSLGDYGDEVASSHIKQNRLDVGLKNYLKTRSTDFKYFDGTVKFEVFSDTIDVYLQIDSHSSPDDPVGEFEHILDLIDMVDARYDEVTRIIKAFLSVHGYGEKHPDVEGMLQKNGIKHFHFKPTGGSYGRTHHYFIQSDQVQLGNLQDFPFHRDFIRCDPNSGLISFPVANGLGGKVAIPSSYGNFYVTAGASDRRLVFLSANQGESMYEHLAPIYGYFSYGVMSDVENGKLGETIKEVKHVDDNWVNACREVVHEYQEIVKKCAEIKARVVAKQPPK